MTPHRLGQRVAMRSISSPSDQRQRLFDDLLATLGVALDAAFGLAGLRNRVGSEAVSYIVANLATSRIVSASSAF
jgi:hypothetical protein